MIGIVPIMEPAAGPSTADPPQPLCEQHGYDLQFYSRKNTRKRRDIYSYPVEKKANTNLT